MAKGSDVKKLIEAYKQGNNEKFEGIVRDIIASERGNNRTKLAKEIENIIDNFDNKKSVSYHHSLEYFDKMPRDNERQNYLIDIKRSQKNLNDVILADFNNEIIDEILDDYKKEYLLKSYNIKPINKILFCGPPGCGKTVTAEALAGELGRPLIYTKLDAIVSSYLGDTASNLRKIFEYIESGRYIVFFDEFDAIGKSRDDSSEHGEIKRVVNSFLQMLDMYCGKSIIVAATNHQGLLDKAVWRRFDEVIYFEKPEESQIEKLIKLKLRTYPKYDLDMQKLSKELKGLSHSDIEMICKNSIKYCVKNNIEILNEMIFSKSIENFNKRTEIYLKK